MHEFQQCLNVISEKVLEPELLICDSHHHIWSSEKNPYLAKDYIKDAGGGHNIKETIVVQSRGNYQPVPGAGMSYVEETAFMMKQNIENLKSGIGIAAGFVGYVDLAAGKAVQAVLEEHLVAGKKKFKGIRYPIQEPIDPKPMADPRVLEGFAFLPKYKLVFEMFGGISQCPDLVELSKKFPNTCMIIEHLWYPKLQGKNPEEKAQILSEWRQAIKLAASIDNIYIKMGGTSHPLRGFGFEKKPPTSEEMAKLVGPYYQYVIEQFGPKRCMFESNYPTDKQGAGYTVIWNTFKLITKSYSNTERADMFYDTARKVYSL